MPRLPLPSYPPANSARLCPGKEVAARSYRAELSKAVVQSPEPPLYMSTVLQEPVTCDAELDIVRLAEIDIEPTR